MEKMTERQLTISTLKALTESINRVQQSVMMQDQFLVNNFRNYYTTAPNIWHQMEEVKVYITELEKLTQSNAENAHRLEMEYDPNVGKDENGNYRRGEVRYVEGDYPQNHSILEAKQRLKDLGDSCPF